MMDIISTLERPHDRVQHGLPESGIAADRILYTKTLRSQYNESKEFSLFGEILYICDRNGERSLAIQNNVPQSTPLISKSLPVRITPNGNLLLLSQIARNLKNDSENLFSW